MNLDERDAVAAQFGVAPEQVERDHLISHLLGFLSDQYVDKVHFIGGTALARTHLPTGRLSEDIDLIALDDRDQLAADLDKAIPRATARTHGRLGWEPALSSVPDTSGAILRSGDGWSLKIQLLASGNRTLWPIERRVLFRRFGPTARFPGEYLFTTPPTEESWQAQLASQTRLDVSAADALERVRDAWAIASA